jgi:outer membrane protein W
VRAVVSGLSDHSEPAGYVIYSGVALEASVVRWFGDAAALLFSLRTESWEVEGPESAGADQRLGSLEMLPMNLSLSWRPRGRSGGDFQPYLGAGVNVTPTWEKSGALDSTQPPTTVGPMLQLGTDVTLAPRAALNMDVRWNTMRVDVVDFSTPTPLVRLDPLSLGMGLTVRF